MKRLDAFGRLYVPGDKPEPLPPPFLTFAMVVRNCASTLEHTLRSLRERAPEAEIVVVDTLSSDAGWDVELDYEAVKAAIPAPEWKADPHGAVRRRLKDAGLDVLWVRLWDEFEGHVWWQPGGVPADARRIIRLRVKGERPDYAVFESTLALANKPTAVIAAGRTTQEIAQTYADVWEEYAGPRGDWTRDMYAVDDMASARQRSFALAHGRFVVWIDSDDLIVPAPVASRLLSLNAANLPPAFSGAVQSGVDKEGTKEAGAITLEQILRYYDTSDPDVEVLLAPYLYEQDLDGDGHRTGVARIWQTRERVLRADRIPGWKWADEAHENLVPVDGGRRPKFGWLLGLLIVHNKEFETSDYQYNLQRHFDILWKKFHERPEERTTRDCLYLANQSRIFCPPNILPFLAEARRQAILPLDRYRALCIEAAEHAARGLWWDAQESIGAATRIRPELPDAWLTIADSARAAERWDEAIDAYVKVMECPKGAPDALVSPRQQVWDAVIRRSECSIERGRQLVFGGHYDLGEPYFHSAYELLDGLVKSPYMSSRNVDVLTLRAIARNDWESVIHHRNLGLLFDFLVRNDETIKASKLAGIVPWTLQDSPFVTMLEGWSKKLEAHLGGGRSDADYAAYYADDAINHLKPTDIDHPVIDGMTFQRIAMVVEWMKTTGRKRLVEVGTWDGQAAIPIMLEVPDVEFTAVEPNASALDRLKRWAEKSAPEAAKKLQTIVGTEETIVNIGPTAYDTFLEGAGANLRVVTSTYDAVLFSEVIEHVPNPTLTLTKLRRLLAPGGRIFVTTPWGAYDRGMPPEYTKEVKADHKDRDPRGHVRAITPRDMVNYLEAADLRPIELSNARADGQYEVGQTMLVAAERDVEAVHSAPRPVAFAVAASLWDWNSRHVHQTGIGASEEMIVYLAKRLASNDHARLIEVYGPTPYEEIHHRVRYWKREQSRKIDPEATIVVSRAPSYVDIIRGVTGRNDQRALLWLQDAYYPDLNEKTAGKYDRVVVLTEFHRRLLHDQHKVPLEKMTVIENFLLPEHFRAADPPVRRPHHFVYASSPDRGLIELLRIWPKILERWDDATLDIFYGWDGCIKLGAGDPGWILKYTRVRSEYEKIRWQKGIVDRGRINHEQLARELLSAGMFVYLPVNFVEVGCAIAFKAKAAGCMPVLVPTGALPETGSSRWTRFVAHDGAPESFESRVIDAIADVIDTPESERRLMADEAIERHGIDRWIEKWKELLG